MTQLTIIDLGGIESSERLEEMLKWNFPFLETKTMTEEGLLPLLENDQLDAWEIIGTLIDLGYNNPVLVVTDNPIYEYDLDLERFVHIDGISYLIAPKISIVSTEGLYEENVCVIRKSIHEVGHFYGLKNHESNPRNRRQCSMVIPEYLYGKARAEGYRLCGLCQMRVDPNFVCK